ncbi:diacylglycerol kinase eta-like isoform X2 [Amphibalanus amphitrite]|uniref:diacylglycerol kinase eta-like isoform X2 n=1 Tax=Amphibalanus amphitrite TaxID=1232801 RepID=UPI001C8FDE54|nr:diacylglycerol kinase eta-like isoform X2 [Amphibalanus amphitrite]
MSVRPAGEGVAEEGGEAEGEEPGAAAAGPSPADESSDSDGETEPARSFHRKISTNKDIKCSVCTKEGYLMKQTSSFQRWKRRYFKLKGNKLYYAKDTKYVVFDEIELTDLSIAESKTGGSHCFQVITAFRCLTLRAETRRQMEEWTAALKSASKRQFYEGMDHLHSLLSGQHNWHVMSHARPTYCNVCREALSGVTSHGLSCEVCKFKCHKRCAAHESTPCKWTTLASVGRNIIEEEDGTLSMPHQWLEGNLSVSARCMVCDRTCGSVLRLQDWRCLWCKGTVHAACRATVPALCPLGVCKVSVVPPIALHSIGADDSWEAARPLGCSPLLVFVNSKSGDHQGIKFLRRFKQLLNPAQVFDLMNSGPALGLRLFKKFDQFRILVCGGDGSVSWVLSHIDKLDMHRQCQVGVLPLGTGNDLARVLGWGSACDDDANLAHMLEKYECATIKMLDRWSISAMSTTVRLQAAVPSADAIAAYEESVSDQLARLLHSERHPELLQAASVLCETVRDLIARVGSSTGDSTPAVGRKCEVLNEKLSLLMAALKEEEPTVPPASAGRRARTAPAPAPAAFVPRDTLMLRANSLKKAIREIMAHAEHTIDERTAAAGAATAAAEAETETKTETETAEWQVEPSPSPMASPYRMAGSMTTSFPVRPWPAGGAPPWTVRQPSPLLAGSTAAPACTVPELAVEPASPEDSPLPTHAPVERRPSEEISQLFAASAGAGHGDGDKTPSPPNPLSISPLPAVRGETPSELEPLPDIPAPTPFADGRRPSEGDVEPVGEQGPASGEGERETIGEGEREPSGERDSSAEPEPEPGRELTGLLGSDTVQLRINSSADSLLDGFDDDEPLLVEQKSVRDGSGESSCADTPPLMAKHAAELERLDGDGDSTDFSGTTAVAEPDVSSSGGGLIQNVLMAHADALCAAASPLVAMQHTLYSNGFEEKGVMNNYFGIGIDAKISLDFHNKREGNPQKCRSRTKNFMWYGVLGSKELIQKTYKNLEQRVKLECDGHVIPLPSLQGIVVLNIPSFMGGTNFWGRRRDEDCFLLPSFDDRILEVVAVFGTVQMAASRIINLQHHRIAQCQTVKITILGDEEVPVEVDGEAWVQQPGVIKITHKNRVQMLARNRSLEASLRTWQEKQQRRQSVTLSASLTDDEQILLRELIESSLHFVRTSKLFMKRYGGLPGGRELQQAVGQTTAVLERLAPAAGSSGTGAPPLAELGSHRPEVSDLVTSVRSLHSQMADFLHECGSHINQCGGLEEQLVTAMSQLEAELRHAQSVHGAVQFTAATDPAEPGAEKQRRQSRGGLFRRRLRREGRPPAAPSPGPPPPAGAAAVAAWTTEEVVAWLESIALPEYRNSFIRHDVRGPELLSLERRDLKELGIVKIGHIKRIQQAIKEIRNTP